MADITVSHMVNATDRLTKAIHQLTNNTDQLIAPLTTMVNHAQQINQHISSLITNQCKGICDSISVAADTDQLTPESTTLAKHTQQTSLQPVVNTHSLPERLLTKTQPLMVTQHQNSCQLCDQPILQSLNKIVSTLSQIKSIISQFQTSPVKEISKFELLINPIKSVSKHEQALRETAKKFTDIDSTILKEQINKKSTLTDIEQLTILKHWGGRNLSYDKALSHTQLTEKVVVAGRLSPEQATELLISLKKNLQLNEEQLKRLVNDSHHVAKVASNIPNISQLTSKHGAKIMHEGGMDHQQGIPLFAWIDHNSNSLTQSNQIIQQLFNQLNAVASGSASPQLSAVFQSLDLSSTTIAEKMKQDTAGTIIDVFKQIDKQSPDQQQASLSALLGSHSDTGQVLLSNMNLYDRLIKHTDNPTSYAISLDDTYQKDLNTISNQWKILQSNLIMMSTSIGYTLRDTLTACIGGLTTGIQHITDFINTYPNLTALLYTSIIGIISIIAA